ncbi:olfactory receptor 6Y1-like [Spea bombifrons]|uniref:olfactory receptor 6Y1-like n=1 Tax=Spea bombifrons TaxID=233779 RepID=UPI002349AE72|nr:olfactory receptor 6Y1-like [Spea bombifrons]
MKVNQSELAEFILLGFPSSRELQVLLFMVFLAFYFLTITTNMFIICIVRLAPSLWNSPMYMFLSHFSFLEIWYTTVTVPKMLLDFVAANNIISYQGCIAQIYFFFALGLTELFFLAVMAYDRYLAICQPLRYNAIMSKTVCNQLAGWSWLCGFLSAFLLIIPSSRLLFCSAKTINHFFCDFIPLLIISCNETLVTDMVLYAVAWVIIFYSFFLTTVSYCYIIRTVLRLPSRIGRKKAFSTCASHLIVVLTFYGTIIFMYIRPTTQYSFNMDKVVSVFYAVVIPLLNPLVYTLRNREVQQAVRKALAKNIFV